MAKDQALTVREICDRYRLKADTVLVPIRAGRLRAINMGAGSEKPRWRILPEDWADFEQSRASRPGKQPPAISKPVRRTRTIREWV